VSDDVLLPPVSPHADPFLVQDMPDPEVPLWRQGAERPPAVWEVLETARHAGRLIDANGVVPASPCPADSPCGTAPRGEGR
jgi:hypothetical protein